MTDKQHTPGPWVVRGSHIHETSPSFGGIATVQTFDNPDWAANARAIAALPDLLEALEDLLNYVGGWDAPADHPCGRARVAIAKATGQ